MDRIIEQMKQVAKQYHAIRLVLFGSRARGDFQAHSDYDFAVWGVSTGTQPLFRDAVDCQIETLRKIDVVFISAKTDAELLNNIKKDGVLLMDRYQTKLDNFTQAVERLREGIASYQNSSERIVRDGVIQRFEFTCELAWKTTREYLIDQYFTELNSPKAVMRQAFESGLIRDDQPWISLLNDRNLTSHMYDDDTAQAIYDKIEKVYLPLFSALLQELKK